MRRTLAILGLIGLTVCLGHLAPVVGQQSGAPPRQPAAKRQRQGFTFQQYAQRHDADKDGKITRDEFKGNPQFFKRQDRNGDGVITEAEFTAAIGRAKLQQSDGSGKVPDGVKAYRNLEYAKVDGQSLKLDLFVSEDTTTKQPLVVYIHGGGFRGGSKDSLNAGTLRELLNAGISVAAVDYRLTSHAPLSAAHDDCRRALQFLRSNAYKWNIDKTRVGAFGGSAGAQLCMYLAFHDDMADGASHDPVDRIEWDLTERQESLRFPVYPPGPRW